MPGTWLLVSVCPCPRPLSPDSSRSWGSCEHSKKAQVESNPLNFLSGETEAQQDGMTSLGLQGGSSGPRRPHHRPWALPKEQIGSINCLHSVTACGALKCFPRSPCCPQTSVAERLEFPGWISLEFPPMPPCSETYCLSLVWGWGGGGGGFCMSQGSFSFLALTMGKSSQR